MPEELPQLGKEAEKPLEVKDLRPLDARDDYEANKVLALLKLRIEDGDGPSEITAKLQATLRFLNESIEDWQKILPKTDFARLYGIEFGFAETSFDLLLSTLEKAKKAGIDISDIELQIPELGKKVREVTLRESVANLEQCIKETSVAAPARFEHLSEAVEKAKKVGVDVSSIEAQLTNLKMEAKRCAAYGGAVNAYLHPGGGGIENKQSRQIESLKKMAETARTAETWAKVYLRAFGFTNWGYVLSDGKDMGIANKALEKLRQHEMEKDEWKKLIKKLGLEHYVLVHPRDRKYKQLLNLLTEKVNP